MENIKDIITNRKAIIGMVHVAALPGTPRSFMNVKEISEQAIKEAKILMENGVDCIMIENMHDIPYVAGEASPEITAAMTAIACSLRENINLPMGIQILAAANKSALSVAKAADLQFIRVENFVFGHLADEGMMNSCAGELLRFRRKIDAEAVMIFTDLKKKHSSHQITADLSLSEMADAASFFLSDGVIITGKSTSQETDINDLEELKSWNKIPKLIGSGINNKNITKYWPLADGFIVGSSFKIDGNWMNPVDSDNVSDFMKVVNKLRN